MSTYSNTAREIEMPNGDVVVLHNAVTKNTTSNIKKFKYDDNGHVTESEAADAEDLNLSSYSTPTTGTTAIGTSDDIQTAIGKLDHQSQIDQSNIWYALETGANNLLDLSNATMVADPSLTVTKDGNSYVVSGNPSTTVQVTFTDFVPCVPITGGKIAVVGCPSGGSTQNGYSLRGYLDRSWECTDFGSDTKEFTTSSINKIVLYFVGGHQYTNVRFTPMVVSEEVWNTLGSDYRPPALPNYDLTYLQAEDRASLAEVVDSGAKNLLKTSTTTISNVTFTQDSNSYITASPNNADTRSWNYANTQYKLNLKAGTYIFAMDIKTATSNTGIGFNLYSSNGTSVIHSEISEILNKTGMITWQFTITTEGTYGVIYKCFDMVARLMICTKAAFGVSQKFVPFGNDPFYQVPINHNMIYRGRNLGDTLTDAQHTALSSGNFTDLYLGDYWTKTVTIPAGTYTGGDGEEVTVPAQTNITLKAVIADFDTFYAGYASSYAGINTHHAAVIVTGFSNVVWNKTNSTAGGYVTSLIHKWLVGSALPQIETWFGSAKVLSHQKLLTNAITGDAASGWAWSSQKISLLSENQMYGSKVWGGSKATNGGYEPGEAFKHLNVFNHIDANLLFGNKSIWLRDIASVGGAANLYNYGYANLYGASDAGIAPAALILLS